MARGKGADMEKHGCGSLQSFVGVRSATSMANITESVD